ncbi:LacI family DNA-binding transcriptional regulator [Veillonella criceti]|uniref:Degradation activator n=1 Tax=Veillonella criceti TaxID=103891 RepID=A0A380NL18_9FIRM|nr:LacI family DNA-binding transcriptional regulator [Veillonella criceti]SUP43319.1 Degradation activator [Veillonella criceti]
MAYSIEDVAREAGVSITTVSRVINNSSHAVSEQTRKKVEKAIKKLDYKPNISAQTLRQPYTNVIAFIARDLSDAYYGEMARGITEAAIKQGVLSFVCNTGRKTDDEMRYHELFNQYRIRGLILGGGGFNTEQYRKTLSEEIEKYKSRDLRIIALAPQGVDIDSVMIDNVDTARRMTDYLLSLGHQTILYVGGPANVCTVQERLKGYKQALEHHNIKINENLIVHTDNTWSGSYEVVQKVLAKPSFTAIFCDNDNVALSVMRAVKDHGLRVPEDISVVGIGGLPNSQYSSPILTTMKIPLYEIGVKAVERLLTPKEMPNVIERFEFPTELQKGNSVKAIK